eukprot:10074240-Karenia_brevis.AAC.1
MATVCNNSKEIPAPCSIDRLWDSNLEILPPAMLQSQAHWTNKMYLGEQTRRFSHHPYWDFRHHVLSTIVQRQHGDSSTIHVATAN